MLSMKKARQRSTDARRSLALSSTGNLRDTLKFEVSLQKRIELAEAELRDLDDRIASFSRADAMIELEETAQHYALRLAEASKRLRTLQSESTRREKELERAAKTAVDHGITEESLRKELFGVRQRNNQLSFNIESSERALEACLQTESKLRSQIDGLRGLAPHGLKSKRNELVETIEKMRLEKEVLTQKWSQLRNKDLDKIEVLKSVLKKPKDIVTEKIESSQEPTSTREEISFHVPKAGDHSLSIIEPTTALQSPAHHALIADPPIAALSSEANPEQSIDLQDEETRIVMKPDYPWKEESILSVVEEESIPIVSEVRMPVVEVEQIVTTVEEEMSVPEIVFPEDPVGGQEEISEEFHATDEAMTAADCAEIESIHIYPRRLFQAASAKEDDSHVLGVRKMSPLPPLIQIPKVFNVESRCSSASDTYDN